MAENTQPVQTDEVTPVAGKADDISTDKQGEDQNTTEVDNNEDSTIQAEQKAKDTSVPIAQTDESQAIQSKSTTPQSEDFFDRYLDKQDQAAYSSVFQSADTYWNSKPDEQQKYVDKYGDQARDKFDQDYKTVENDWRSKLEEKQNEVSINDRYSWLFDPKDKINYDTAPVFEAVHEIANGSRRIGDLLTDKQISDQQAALTSKTYMNDQGELIKLGDNEKYWKWSAGPGFAMNSEDPKYRSKDGRQLVGFEYVGQNDPEFRGTPYIKGIYENDVPKGEVVSMWDTMNNWAQSNGLKSNTGLVGTLAKTAVRTAVNGAIDLMTGGVSLLRSADQFLAQDDKSNFINWANNFVTGYDQLKFTKSEYDTQKPVTMNNALDMIANMAGLIYGGKGILNAAQGLTKGLMMDNELLVAAREAEAIGDSQKAKYLVSQFEMKFGQPARIASAVAINLEMSNSVAQEARAAGFSEKETAGLYIANFAALFGVSKLAESLIDPYISNAAAKPAIDKLIKESIPQAFTATTDEAKIGWARRLSSKIGNLVSKTFLNPSELQAEAKFGSGMGGMVKSAVSGASTGTAYWASGEAVKMAGTVYAHFADKGDPTVPKFDTLFDDGYWARQLPGIITNAIGGALGGTMTKFLPGFEHQNEDGFLLKGEQAERLQRIAMAGGQVEDQFLRQLKKQKESGALGPKELSVKINEKTGEFYKMTDPEAANTMSHPEASYRTIMNQYLVYKTLYGGASSSYDDMIKTNPKFKTSIEYQKRHVFFKEISDLHQQKQSIIKELNGPILNQPPDKNAKPTGISADVNPPKITVKDTKIKGSDPGVTSEIKEPSIEDQNKANKAYSEEVIERAKQYQIKNYDLVKRLVDIDHKIDNMLSGNVAAQQVARSIARTNRISVFMDDAQKDVFHAIKNSNGEIEDSKFAFHKDDLLEKVFSADANLAKGHSQKYADYIEAANRVKEIINAPITVESIAGMAADAIRNPKAMAIDRDTDQINRLKKGVNDLISQLVGSKQMETLALAARIGMSLNTETTTKDYVSQLGDLYSDWMMKYVPEGTDEMSLIPRSGIEAFVKENSDLVYKASLSRLIDRLVSNPMGLLTTRISLNKGEFIEKLIDSMDKAGSVTVAGYDTDQTGLESATKAREDLAKDLEAALAKEPKTANDREKQQREVNELRSKIQVKDSEVEKMSMITDLVGPIDAVVANFGANTIIDISKTTDPKDLVDVVKSNDDKVASAKEIIGNYRTVLNNIAPVVPTVPRFGAAYNLLNMINASNNTIESVADKIISEDEGQEGYTTLASGETINTNLQPSIVEQLESQIVRPNTDMAEFRDIENAKLVLDGINIRLGQVALLKSLMSDLGKLKTYTDEHIPEGNVKYNHIPKFMSEYVFDPVRFDYLNEKSILTPDEKQDFDSMRDRIEVLTNFNNPLSVYSRLMNAKERVQRLIEMGEKSATANERARVYKTELATTYNQIRNGVNLLHIDDLSKEVSDAVNKLNNVGQFVESSADGLLAGKAAIDELQRALYKLPLVDKQNFLAEFDYGGDKKAYTASKLVVDAMACNVDHFNHYYGEALAEAKAANPDMLAPTFAQERMIRSTFSFLTDPIHAFKTIKDSSKYNLFFVNGGSGTGKTTMIGYAFRAAQMYMNTQSEAMNGISTTPRNTVLYAANLTHQAETLRDRCNAIGVKGATSDPLDKYALFDRLEKAIKDPKDNMSNISVIAVDEATFLQSTNDENKPELQVLHDRVNEINERRAANTDEQGNSKPLLPMKVILIGDNEQGGWQKGMATIYSPVEDRYKPINYNNLEAKIPINLPGMGINMTEKLTYPFRGVCDKIPEINNKILEISNEQTSTALSGNMTTKLTVSSGVISNDVPERGRYGGVKLARSKDELYIDDNLVTNIDRQFAQDEKDGVTDPKKKFSVIIVDNNAKDASGLPAGATGLKNLIAAHPDQFKFYTIDGVQGQEADYVIANIPEIFPTLPVVGDAAKSKLQCAAMVISRARLYSKIAIRPDINVVEVNNSVITMLTPTNAAELSKDWNNFYLDDFHKVSQPTTAPTIDVTTQNIQTEAAAANKGVPKIETKQEELIKSGDQRLKTVNKTVPRAYVTDEVPYNADTITDQQAVRRTEDAKKILADKTASEADKKKAEEDLKSVPKNTISVVEPVEKPAVYTERLENNIVEKQEPNNSAFINTDDEAKKIARELEEKFQVLYGYSRIATGVNLNDGAHDEELAKYASDLWGWRGYKVEDKKYHSFPTGNIEDTAVSEIRAARKAILGIQGPGEHTLDAYKNNISLVSFQMYDPKLKRDVVVHQIYAQRGDKGLKVPVFSITGPRLLSPTGEAVKTLIARETALVNLSDGFKNLQSLDSNKFVARESKEKYGFAGAAMTNENMALVKSTLSGKGFKTNFPDNTKNTKFGRTFVSDEDSSYKSKGKVSQEHFDSGLFFMETKLGNIGDIFKANTAGKPLRDSEGGKLNYVKATGDTKNYPNANDNVLLNNIKGELGVNERKFPNTTLTTANLLNLVKNGYNVLKPMKVGDATYPVMRVGDYNVITFNGNENRSISMVYKNTDAPEVLFGFDSTGKPITIKDMPELVEGDMEVRGLTHMLQHMKIVNKELLSNIDPITKLPSLSPNLEPAQANVILGDLYSYNPADIADLPRSAQLTQMSKDFVKRKVESFADKKLSFAAFKSIMEDQHIQVSDPLVFTRSTKGGQEGKSYVLYTQHDKSKYDLSKTEDLTSLLFKLAVLKPSDITSDKFDPEQYTRHGVGIIMLDTKLQSITELAERMKSVSAYDINRATTPIDSASNRRMVMFCKELAQMTGDIAQEANASAIFNTTHTRLAKLGLDETGKPVENLFTPETRETAKSYLRSLDDDTFTKLHSLMTTITADEHMGKMIVTGINEPERIQTLLALPLDQRMQYWDDNFVKGTVTAEEGDSINNLQLSRDNLSGYAMDDLTKMGNIKGSILVNEDGIPVIEPVGKGVISFIPSDVLSQQAGIPIPAATGQFNMVNFLHAIKLVAGDGSLPLTNAIDTIMRNYTQKGTLNRGVLWSGRKSAELDRSLGTAKLLLDDSSSLLQTSVKEIDLPSMIIDIPNFLKELSEKAEMTSAPVADVAPKVAEFKKSMTDYIQNRVSQLPETVDKQAVEDLREELARDIAQSFSGKESLFKTGEGTIIRNELEKNINDQIDARLATAPDATKNIKPDGKVVDDYIKGSNGYATVDPTRLVPVINEEISDSLKFPAEQDRIDALEAVRVAVNEENRLSPEQIKAFNETIQNHMDEINKIPVIPATPGESLIKTLMTNFSTPTPEQSKLLEELHGKINDWGLSKNTQDALPLLVESLTNREKEWSTGDVGKIQDAMDELFSKSITNLTDEQFANFDDILNSMKKPIC